MQPERATPDGRFAALVGAPAGAGRMSVPAVRCGACLVAKFQNGTANNDDKAV